MHNFARYGIPEVVITDREPQFTSEEFKLFAEKWECRHQMSSLYHHQANGKSENSVKTAKRILQRCLDTGEDYQLALLQWRNTVSQGFSISPFQRLMSRRARKLLPVARKTE